MEEATGRPRRLASLGLLRRRQLPRPLLTPTDTTTSLLRLQASAALVSIASDRVYLARRLPKTLLRLSLLVMMPTTIKPTRRPELSASTILRHSNLPSTSGGRMRDASSPMPSVLE